MHERIMQAMQADLLGNVILPESMQEIVDIIGITAAVQLVKNHGGTGMLIPKINKPCRAYADLVIAVGTADAAKLMQHFRGTFIYIPRCDKALRELRDNAFVAAVSDIIILKKISQDRAFFELCPKFKITMRTAFHIMTRYKRDNKGRGTQIENKQGSFWDST